MSSKIVTAEDAVAAIPDGAMLAVCGTGPVLEPDLLLEKLEERFVATGHPRGLTLFLPMLPGDRPGTGGLNTFAHEGMVARIYGASFSRQRHDKLLDLIRAVAEQTGPAALTVSTWSTGIRDTQNMGVLQDQGMFTSVRLCLDRSFAGRQPRYMSEVIRVWGEENIRMTRNHCKFFMLRNDQWNICCRSSMNLNRNPRLEQYDLDDSLKLCEFFEEIIDEIFDKMPPGLTRTSRKCDQVFAEVLGGGLSDSYSAKDLAKMDFTLKDVFIDL